MPISLKNRTSALVLSLLAGTALLTACGRDDNRTAGQQVDAAIAKTEQKAGEVAADAREVGREAGQAVGQATDSAVNKTRDIAITAEVNAKLARDEQLSALQINVDTAAGRVVLRGSAPDTASRTRATELARAVDGVVSVDNELNVQPRSN
jgi:hyperosmotically inducible periplasmic protein